MLNSSSFDENGPLISMGVVEFSARAGGLPGGIHEFEVPVYMVASDESKVIIEYNGMRLFDFGTFNDYYGFGSSAHTALSDTQEKITQLEGINADIMVLTTIEMRPCLISEEAPFYCGSQRVHYLPRDWSHNSPDIKETTQDFVVWQNGGPTGDAGYFYDRIRELVESDAGPSRKGDLRSIIKGNRAKTRDNFLSMHQNIISADCNN